MQTPQRTMRTQIFVGVAALALFFLSADSSVLTAQNAGEVKILIKDSIFEFQGGVLRPNEPGIIIVRNLDAIQHGFTSPLIAELEVRVESANGVTYGRGIKGVYINPGEALQIRFTPNRPGSFPFRCDIHPNMKGELVMLSMGGV